jgi:hypothetical protein
VFPAITPAIPYSNSLADLSFHDFQFLGQLRTLTADQFANGYDVADKADITFTGIPVPEPATFGMFGLMLGSLLAIGRVRRKGIAA